MAEVNATEAPSGTGSWVGTRLDGPGLWTLRNAAPYLLGLLMLFDSWDSVVIAYTIPSISIEMKLDAIQSGWLISAGYAGQFLGAILFGTLAEKFGRLPVLRTLVIVMSLLAIGCALVTSYDQLITLRFIQGLSIGGALPVAISYVNEIAPTATRGRFFSSFQFLMAAGFGIALIASFVIVPAYGWRPMYAIGAAPLLILPFCSSLPESPRWLAAKNRVDDALRSLQRLGSAHGENRPSEAELASAQTSPKIPFARLFAPGTAGKSVVTALLWFLTSLVSFGLVTWIPSLYVKMFNIPPGDALRYNLTVGASIFVLPVILRFTIDRIGRRPPVILGTALGGIALLAMTFVPIEKVLLLVSLAIIGQIGISVGSLILWPYTAEIYETRIRSLALGAASSLARGASMLTPLLVGVVLAKTGSAMPVFVIFGITGITVALLWLLATRETAGKQLGE